MEPKSFYLCLCIFLFLKCLPLECHAKSHNPTALNPSAFEFISHLQGSRKGMNVSGLRSLKIYLEKFGYLNYHDINSQTHEQDNHFDDLLESAIKTYQVYYNITPTGVLDPQTVSRMVTPRCGVPDIVKGIVRNYNFSGYKWPSTKTHLTYAFPSSTDPRAVKAVGNAFNTWASVSHFKFAQIQDFNDADLKVSFERRDHGDGQPFDGPGGVLAHAAYPTDGRFHYDVEEPWVVGAVPYSFDLESAALHEIGHLLGLAHSSVPDAIMYAQLPSGSTKGLHTDDIQGIRALYNI